MFSLLNQGAINAVILPFFVCWQFFAKCVQGSRKYMLGRPHHIFLALAQACIFDIRLPMYYFSLIFLYKTIYFLYISIIFLYFLRFSYIFLLFLASIFFGCPVLCGTAAGLCGIFVVLCSIYGGRKKSIQKNQTKIDKKNKT